MSWDNETIAIFVARTILGILFFVQGYDKVFKVRIEGVIATFKDPMHLKRVPDFMLVLAAYFTSFVELIGGFLLIIGFMKKYALLLLGVDMILVAAAFSIMKPMWDLQYFFPRLVLLIFVLLSRPAWDVISTDYLLKFFRVFHA